MDPYLNSVYSLPIVPRKEWGAVRPKERERLDVPVRNIVISHTKTECCKTREECIKLMQQMQTQHIAEGQPDIRFNFMVGGDGVIYEGRGWDFCPWKHPEFPQINGCVIEISHVGTSGSKAQWNELIGRLQLIEYGEVEGYISTERKVEYYFESNIRNV